MNKNLKGGALIHALVIFVFAVSIVTVMMTLSNHNLRMAYAQTRRLEADLAAISGYEIAYGFLNQEYTTSLTPPETTTILKQYAVAGNSFPNTSAPQTMAIGYDVLHMADVTVTINKVVDPITGGTSTEVIEILSVSEVDAHYRGLTYSAEARAQIDTATGQIKTINVRMVN